MVVTRQKGSVRFRGMQEEPEERCEQLESLMSLEQQPTASNRTQKFKMTCFHPPKLFFTPNWFSALWIIAALSVLGTVLYLVSLAHQCLPKPLAIADVSSVTDGSERFITERAKADLEYLIKLGPRPVGSYENEVLARNFLKDTILKIKENSSNLKMISISEQVVTGSFFIKQNSGYASYYDKVQNIVVRLSAKNRSNTSAVLMNCHYDSVPGSPGASDDAFHCAVMLEILRVLSHSNKTLLHDIIFLFNGAEESGLQASHGFVTKHEWAKDVRTFVNLEGCGAGGKEILFQTGPNSPWLVQMYANVPHPHATVMAEELFQSNVIPSDTDFRIFRDFGHIPGFDFANIDNGFVYHTRFDNGKLILPGSFQHTGDNMLVLAQALANSSLLDSTDKFRESMIYFDFLGILFIYYTKTTGTIINYVVGSLSVCSILGLLMRIKTAAGLSLRQITCMFISNIFGVIYGSIFFPWLYTTYFGVFLTQSYHSQSYYGSFFYLFTLYIVPIILLCLCGCWSERHKLHSRLPISQESMMYSLANQLGWTTLLFCGTLAGIRSSYILLIMVLFPTIAYFGLICLKSHNSMNWIAVTILQTTIPVIVGIYHSILALAVFIPITNRSGNIDADLFISLFLCVLVALVISHLAPLGLYLRNVSVVGVLFSIHFIGIIALFAISPLQYYVWSSGESGVLQRVPIWHVERTASSGSRLNDSGYWLMPMDQLSPHILLNDVPELTSLEKAAVCDQLFCGLPLYSPRTSKLVNDSLWLPGPKPFNQSIYQMKSHKSQLTPAKKRIFFEISGPQQMSFMFSPMLGVNASDWSLEAQLIPSTTFKERPAYFIFYQRGLDGAANKPDWNFHIDFEVLDNGKGEGSPEEIVTVGLAGSHIDSNYFSSDFKAFIAKFPNWTMLTPRASMLDIGEI